MSIDPITITTTALKYGLGVLWRYARHRRAKRLNESLSENDVIIVLEVGRSIKDDVEAQLGEIDFAVSYVETISLADIPKIAAEIYQAIKIANRLSKGKRIVLVLSGPVALSFELGQLVGLDHYDLVVAQWQKGEYVLVTPPSRRLI